MTSEIFQVQIRSHPPAYSRNRTAGAGRIRGARWRESYRNRRAATPALTRLVSLGMDGI